jgi:hypothetical protein
MRVKKNRDDLMQADEFKHGCGPAPSLLRGRTQLLPGVLRRARQAGTGRIVGRGCHMERVQLNDARISWPDIGQHPCWPCQRLEARAQMGMVGDSSSLAGSGESLQELQTRLFRLARLGFACPHDPASDHAVRPLGLEFDGLSRGQVENSVHAGAQRREVNRVGAGAKHLAL